MKQYQPRLTAFAVAFATALPAMIAGNAHAQEEPESTDLDRVQVTGTRIRRDDLEGPAPVAVIDREAIERTGHTRLSDLLQEFSASGSALNTAFNAPDQGGDGGERVSLRNLGPERTLVMVNGRRWVKATTQAGVANAADLSTIPTAAIERIEILTGGASSVYGSDAIAGVINVITRKNFTGTSASAQYGQTSESDGEEEAYSFTIGRGDDNSNLLLNLSYTKQKEIMAADRKISRVPQFGADTFGGAISRGSSATPEGRFVFTNPETGETVDLTRDPGTGMPSLGDFRTFDGTADRFNFAPDNYLQIPLEQTSAYIQATHEFSPEVRFFTEAFYNRRESTQLQAPVPIFMGSAGILPLDVGVSADNPYNPFGFDLDARDNLILIGRRFVEAGTRNYNGKVDTWRWTGGFEGNFEIADRLFDWDVSYTFSRSERNANIENLLNHDRLARALGPIDQCTGSCVPFNIFGGQQGTGNAPGSGGSITPEMVDYVTYTALEQNEQKMANWLANIGGELFDLPAGPLAFAAGFEKRREFAADTPDPLAQAGSGASSVSGGQRAPTSGRLNLEAWYAEVNVPLLADVPGADLLELDASVRASDFEQFGTETTSRLGVRWRPYQDMLVRASYAEGFRAPGVQELFGGQGVADPELADPCSNFLDTGVSQEVIDNCISQGVPADGSYEQINTQIRITTGGNPDLEPETSESFTVGTVWTPEAVPGLNVAIDYYNIELDNSISSIGAQSILDACAFSLRLCNLVERSSSGEVSSLLDTQVNIGGTETAGVDWSIDYRFGEQSWGNLRTIWRGTYTSKFEESVPDFSDPDAPEEVRDLLGTMLPGQPDRSFPKWRSNLDLIWGLGDWEAVWNVQYIHSYTEGCNDGLSPSFVELGLCSNPDPVNPTNKLDSVVYNDFQLSYFFDDWDFADSKFTIGVDNVFDEDPPVSMSAFANSFDASQHRIPGQFYYARVNFDF
ncbi:TonB-dependent receptor [Wenzhouxiangella sp. XN201]|uniref:TonB-dependent receptor domain-containing protein n=1 Tax=Wenzhouxiangella sp. XN201 TaxID=2710755 RepID=UPI0013C8181C|nr:TonB-dependent receptor [Wenzhouxiangella sp. XN201]NEZ03334.1 TonB-dependent receptor [Wenzhouxiangella sp. XN201]